jgi:hypothetical protein
MLMHHARRPQAGDLSGFYVIRTSNIGFTTAWAVGRACIGLERVMNHLATGARTHHLPGTNPLEELNVLLRD